MRKTTFIFLAILFAMNTVISQEKGTNNLDKKLALDLLNRSWEELEKTVGSLSVNELTFIPNDGGWSVINCLEHLALVDPVLAVEIKKMIEKNMLDITKDLSTEDGLIISYITDRTKKVTTPKPFRPLEENKNKSKEDFLKEIKQTRTELIDLLETTKADLRHLFGPYPYGEADAYQQFIIAAAHTQRHIMQIQEILKKLEQHKSK